MKLEMRIVGMNEYRRKDEPFAVFVQTRTIGDWEQASMSEYEFSIFMQNKFPKYYEEYQKHTPKEGEPDELPAFVFFYNYGETEENKRKGEAFVFSNMKRDNRTFVFSA